MSSDFFQTPPRIGNQFDEDLLLRSFLRRKLPAPVHEEVEPDLRRLGARVASDGDITALGDAAEAEPPRHVPYDAWGNRVDRIEVSAAWRALDRVSAEEGLVAIAYERRHGALSRIHQLAKLYLFGPSSAIYTCPLAMTDGAARAIELHGDADLKERAYRRLISRDPRRFWTSGQWMTERTGGSDVGPTSTVARREGSAWRLYGTKWFTSATTSQMAMTLARPEGAPEGSRGLGLFFVELHDAEGKLRGIRVHRLKDKLGTRALPTAELTLEGTPAVLVGGEGGGVRKIASLFNITRVANACSAAGYMRRGLALARDYSRKRLAFGKLLAEHPLHARTLDALEVELHAAFHLVFRTAELLGRDETGEASPGEQAVLRLLTPLAKLFTAKQAVASASEVLECFGGAGYVEETGLPRLLRDSQVLAIWEGTTNVLSLDVLRAIEKDGALEPFLADARTRLASVRAPELAPAVRRATEALGRVALPGHEAEARQFAFGLTRAYAASLLLEHADWTISHRDPLRDLSVSVATSWLP
jgi:alkylation response protein AidB-like acyl-CoA dehydrogenase